jgi:hypothetical protein
MPGKLDDKSETERLHLRVSRSWLARIDGWRRAHPEIPTQSAAIRHLVDLAIAADRERKGQS